jgi:glucokinase
MHKKKNPGKNFSILGLDLGGTKLELALVSQRGAVTKRRRVFLPMTGTKREFFRELVRHVSEMVALSDSVAAVGVASCGPLDEESGVLLQPTNFPKWGDLQIKKCLEDSTGLPVYLRNDAAAAAMAEAWFPGRASSLRNWITLTLGTGLGTGIVLDRNIFLGGAGVGPEAGHMIITDKLYPCGCGNLGCAEAALSGTALARRAKTLMPELTANASDGALAFALVQAAKKGHPVAINVLREYSELLARLIHNLCVTYAPEVIFFAGGLAKENALFLPAARVIAKKMLQGRPGFMPRLMLSGHGPKLGVRAGAWVALQAMRRR